MWDSFSLGGGGVFPGNFGGGVGVIQAERSHRL